MKPKGLEIQEQDDKHQEQPKEEDPKTEKKSRQIGDDKSTVSFK